MHANTSPLQPDTAGPDLADVATLWATFRRAHAVMLPDLPDPTPEEFREAVDAAAAILWRDGL
jgi:hypothetical protein